MELARATPRDSSIDRPRRSRLCAPVRGTGAVPSAMREVHCAAWFLQ
jgi:hypothetical protein